MIGFSKTADTSRVNNILGSEKANEIFGQYKRVKFLWSKEYYTKEKGYNFEGHQLMAIEVPKNGEAKINGEDIKSVTQLRVLVNREVERWAVSILRDGKIRSLVVER